MTPPRHEQFSLRQARWFFWSVRVGAVVYVLTLLWFLLNLPGSLQSWHSPLGVWMPWSMQGIGDLLLIATILSSGITLVRTWRESSALLRAKRNA